MQAVYVIGAISLRLDKGENVLKALHCLQNAWGENTQTVVQDKIKALCETYSEGKLRWLFDVLHMHGSATTFKPLTGGEDNVD